MKLTDVVDRINGNVDRFTTELEYYIGGEHFESNELEVTQKGLLKENLGKLGFKFHFAFQDRDVVFMARNPHLRKAGMVRFAGLCSDASYILRSKDETVLSQEYLAVMLQSDHFWDYCESHKVGSVNFANNWSSIANYEFELPTPEEQKEISDQVWAAYRLKQSYKKLLAATEEMVKSQFIEMFKHKRPNGKIADLVDVNIKSVKKSFNKEDMIEYIDISSVNAKNRTLNETTQYIVASAPSRAQQCVQNGDILVSTVRPINRNVAVVNRNLTNLVASTGFCVLRPIDGYREYLLAIVTSDKYTEKMCDIASGGLYPAVNNSDVLSYDIFIPDKDFLHRVTQIYQQADKSGSVGLKSGLNFAKLLIHR